MNKSCESFFAYFKKSFRSKFEFFLCIYERSFLDFHDKFSYTNRIFSYGKVRSFLNKLKNFSFTWPVFSYV